MRRVRKLTARAAAAVVEAEAVAGMVAEAATVEAAEVGTGDRSCHK
jgi:hypothetical protein